MGAGSLTLLEWRRTVRDLYAAVRRESDPAAAHALWRRGRNALFGSHPDSPLDRDDARRHDGLPVADYDPALRFVVPLEPAEPARIEVPTATDGVVPFHRIGMLRLDELGTLDAWWLGSYGGGLFVPVRDATAGRTSYGGGRYLLDTVKGADLGSEDDRLVVDLNFLYNPSCAYDPAWACPLPPPGNVLPVAVDAGEQMPDG